MISAEFWQSMCITLQGFFVELTSATEEGDHAGTEDFGTRQKGEKRRESPDDTGG